MDEIERAARRAMEANEVLVDMADTSPHGYSQSALDVSIDASFINGFKAGYEYASHNREILERLFWFARGYEIKNTSSTTNEILDEFLEFYKGREEKQ